MSQRIVNIICFPIAVVLALLAELVWRIFRGGKAGDS